MALRLFSKKLLTFTVLAALPGTILPELTLAACTPSAGNGVTTVCTGTQTSPVGNGKANDASVEVRDGALLSTGNQSAISLYDRADIVVRDGGIVENNATGGGGGFFGTGPNTIEFNSGGTLTVEEGAIVRAKGTITNGEAVNVHGSGNTVVNRGLIQSQSGASIWFEDQSSGAENVVDNYGTVRALNGGSVIGNSGSGPVRFTNRTGATVEGSLSFANGNDTLDLEAGSVITGNFNGGGGRNSLLLQGWAQSSDTLVGDINNFQLLTKEGQGRWTLSGSVGNNGGGTAITILVDEGTLALTGDNSGFNGTATVDQDGVLESRAQSLMSAVTNDGLVRFVQNDTGTYSGVISGSGAVEKIGTGITTLTPTGAGNTYAGGTRFTKGSITINRDAALGAASGGLTFNGGTLQFNASTNIAASRDIIVEKLGGAINTNGNATSVSQAIEGTGALTKLGAGTLTLTDANTYAGGTLIMGGTLQLGNGGTTGAIVGSVIDNATLAFNRSNRANFAGTISGFGSVSQTGSGDTVLTADNAYEGTTNVNAGGLFINGDQSAATGTTTVRNGATLGGFGTVGGDVTVSNGGHLAPGGLGTAAGTFTINGDLSLAGGAFLDYNLGEADAVAGELNDDTVVKGDLTLDGTINVETTPGGTFGAGVYRIIDYAGSLTNNGLEIGTIPSPNFFVQTSIDKQVNLINTEGLLLNYWDGAAGLKNDGSIQGGDGVWQNSSGNDNWTDFEGTPNAPFDNGAFAIFSADPGVVTIDDSLGGVQVSGMQFASDGYRINGNPLTLTGTNVIVRVGDGTLAGRNFEAMLDTRVSGTAHLEKTDLGTLILSQQNDYSGGTKITRGTLQLGNGAASGSIVGNVENNGTLAFNRANSLSFSGAISGTGRVTQIGGGVTTLLGASTFSGGTTITNGTLRLGNGGTSGSITGDVRNDGTFAFNRSNTLTFGGLISGAGDVTQTGTGTTILTGDSLYSGGTTITQGIFQLGDGGTSGSIIGDIENNAVLVLDRSNDLSLRGLISGTGNLTQAGGGDTTLTGDNTYAGTTTVNAGGLFIDGDQSGATGVTTVNNSAIIGGRGTIGGDVDIADGGTLMPGDRGDFAGTLTINGDLGLADGATLEYQFGEADAAGGGFNDLTNVEGDLVLDGTLNVSTTPGGTFDPGIYRVINYSGTLTDNGLDIGTIPTPDFFVQTSIDKQVNLINESGLQLNYWDGGPGPKNDGVIAGGDGTWQNFTGNDNWTEFSGSINAPFEDSAFAVFTAAPGTVTVDGSLGDVRVSGMQFASDGYLITGDDVTLTGTRAKIRVGDSTTAGAGYTAEIASELTGTTNLVKIDVGTLVLSGSNTYTGGTTVLGGVIEVSQDANLGDAAGGLNLGFGALHTTASFSSARDVNVTVRGVLDTDAGTTLTLDGDISGAGRLVKDGDGQLTLTGAATHGLGTVISAGTLQLGNGGTSGSLAGNVTNNGSLVFNRSNTLGLAGNIFGSGDVEQAGTGRTVLVGSNTYTGGTTITGGTLQLGNGGTSGSIVGDVTDDGTLAFARSDTVTFGGIISGTVLISTRN